MGVRIAATLPMQPGQVECREFEYRRHGTTTLIGNFHVVTGQLIAPTLGATRTEEDFVRHVNSTLGGATTQMLIFIGGSPVILQPKTTNVDQMTGVSTAMLFGKPDPAIKKILDLDESVFREAPALKHRQIPDLIANPQLAHFFNTDCVSCHSESTRRKDLGISGEPNDFRYVIPEKLSGVQEAVLPTDKWNVRNVGWFPSRNEKVMPTVTVRTANEAAESAEFINREYLGHKK